MTENERQRAIRSADLEQKIWLAISGNDESDIAVIMDALATVGRRTAEHDLGPKA